MRIGNDGDTGVIPMLVNKIHFNPNYPENKNIKLTAEIENADFRVEMEMDRAAKANNAKDEFAYQLKEQKAINADQLEELKRLTKINQVLKEKNIKLKSISTENQLKNIIVGTAGLFAGLSLKR